MMVVFSVIEYFWLDGIAISVLYRLPFYHCFERHSLLYYSLEP